MHYHITALAASAAIVAAMRERLRSVGITQIEQDAGGRHGGRGPEILVQVRTDDHERVAVIQEVLVGAGGTGVACIEESAAHDALR